MQYAQPGSVSRGTLRTEDLLAAFSDALECLQNENANEIAWPDHTRYSKLIGAAEWIDPESENASELINELQDALSEFASAYYYFGTNEGDGSDFGFWPCMDQIAELPRVKGSDEAKALGEDCAFVNDHGNVTVYRWDGSVVLELV